ncbi:hypothetical protein MA16_Dca009822 [Dendrobium catenatum]|uniref:Uncharacterized protein n=1 Tax=Dendrobium catenatum TaxID=906689 RepID=A0A2I0XIC3_9ASPA|nr:hypothetical protein MA16_Dca009822 [Dendrobium catenatum]
MSYSTAIIITILFLVTAITFIFYLFCSHSTTLPPLQPEHNIEIRLNDATLRA